MKNEIEKLRVALRDAANRDSSGEMCSILEKMLDEGMLRYFSGTRYGRRVEFWTTDGSKGMLDRIHSMDCLNGSCILQLFLEQRLVFCTNRRSKPGIYFFLSPTEALIQ